MTTATELQQQRAQVKAARKKVTFFGSQVMKKLVFTLALASCWQNKAQAQLQMYPETDFSKDRLELFFNDTTVQKMNTLERLEVYKRAYAAEFTRRVYLKARDLMLRLKAANNNGKTRNRAAIKQICGNDTKDITRYCMQFVTKVCKLVDEEMSRQYGSQPIYGQMVQWMKSPQSCKGVIDNLTLELPKKNVPIGHSSLKEYFQKTEELGMRGPAIGVNRVRHVNKKTGAVSYSNHAVLYFAFKNEDGDLQLMWISANRESENAERHAHPYALFTYCGAPNMQDLTFAYTKSAKLYEGALQDNHYFAQAKEPETINVDISGAVKNLNVTPIVDESVLQKPAQPNIPHVEVPALKKKTDAPVAPRQQARKMIQRRL